MLNRQLLTSLKDEKYEAFRFVLERHHHLFDARDWSTFITYMAQAPFAQVQINESKLCWIVSCYSDNLTAYLNENEYNIARFNATDIANLIVSLGEIKRTAPRINEGIHFDVLAQLINVLINRHDCTAVNVTDTLWGITSLLIGDTFFSTTINSTHISALLNKFIFCENKEPIQFATILRVMLLVINTKPNLVTATFRSQVGVIVSQFKNCGIALTESNDANESPDLANDGVNKPYAIGIALETLGKMVVADPRITEELATSDVAEILAQFTHCTDSNPEHISQALWGIAKLHEADERIAKSVNPVHVGALLNLQAVCNNNSTIQISKSLWAIAKLASSNKVFWHAAPQSALSALIEQFKRNPQCTQRSIHNVLWALTILCWGTFADFNILKEKLKNISRVDAFAARQLSVSHAYCELILRYTLFDPTNLARLHNTAKRDKPTSSRFHQNVAQYLPNPGEWQSEYFLHGYSVDLCHVNDKIVIQVNGPTHYDESGELTQKNKLPCYLLDNAGWKIVFIPSFEWDKLENKDKAAYLQQKIDAARNEVTAQGTASSSDDESARATPQRIATTTARKRTFTIWDERAEQAQQAQKRRDARNVNFVPLNNVLSPRSVNPLKSSSI